MAMIIKLNENMKYFNCHSAPIITLIVYSKALQNLYPYLCKFTVKYAYRNANFETRRFMFLCNNGVPILWVPALNTRSKTSVRMKNSEKFSIEII